MATPPRPPASPRFAGRMRTPEGETLIYLRDGEQTILAKPGLALSSGYIVVSLLPAPAASGAGAGTIVAVRLFHAASQHHEELRLPSDNEPR